MLFSNLLFADSKTVDIAFRIPQQANMIADKVSMIDFGSTDLLNEVWGPVGESNSYKVIVQNNISSTWEFRVNLLGDLQRENGTDPIKDVISVSDVKWALVYALVYDENENKIEAREQGDESNILGLQPNVMINNSALEKGIAFTTLGDNSRGLVFRNQTTDKSYQYQFVFKFIVKPPITATAGDYNGRIIFTMLIE
jgi:hypothetical protein